MPKTKRKKQDKRLKVFKDLVDHLLSSKELKDAPRLTDLESWDWDNLDGRDLSYILLAFPDLNVHPKYQKKLQGSDIERILEVNPKFAEKLDANVQGWEKKLKATNWARLLRVRPEFESRCKCWNEFKKIDCECLIKEYRLLTARREMLKNILVEHLAVTANFQEMDIKLKYNLLECMLLGETNQALKDFVFQLVMDKKGKKNEERA